jgi:hypothetical protein
MWERMGKWSERARNKKKAKRLEPQVLNEVLGQVQVLIQVSASIHENILLVDLSIKASSESFTHCWVESVLFFSFFSFSFFGIYEMTVSVCGFMRLDECKGGGSYAVLRLYLEWDWRWLWRVMMFLGFII